MDFEAAPFPVDPIARPRQLSAFVADTALSQIAAERHQDVMESWRDIIKFESRQN
jgi:hypothetical protein